MKKMKFLIKKFINLFFEFLIFPILLIMIVLSKLKQKKIDVGLGPEPLINNIYHKKALQKVGYSAETFTFTTYYITSDFDIILSSKFKFVPMKIKVVLFFIFSVFRYKCLYIYFNGGILFQTNWLWRIEPFLYNLAGIKTVVMPYGSDIQDMSLSNNLYFKHCQSNDYPSHRKKQALLRQRCNLWTNYGDHIISGCEWVDYMHHWDTLMLAHFSIDTELWSPKVKPITQREKIKILHAPNHRMIKGSSVFINTIRELIEEGYPFELKLLEKVPNSEIKTAIAEADIIADQLVVGWYAMFAIEAMAMGKPVLCYLRKDLEELYIKAGLIKKDEIPIINCSSLNIKEKLIQLVEEKDSLTLLGKKSREYVLNHHSLHSVGNIFFKINLSLGINLTD